MNRRQTGSGLFLMQLNSPAETELGFPRTSSSLAIGPSPTHQRTENQTNQRSTKTNNPAELIIWCAIPQFLQVSVRHVPRRRLCAGGVGLPASQMVLVVADVVRELTPGLPFTPAEQLVVQPALSTSNQCLGFGNTNGAYHGVIQ